MELNCDCNKPIIRVGWIDEDDLYHIACLNCDKEVSGETINQAEIEWNKDYE